MNNLKFDSTESLMKETNCKGYKVPKSARESGVTKVDRMI
jgi:hypothetical protein